MTEAKTTTEKAKKPRSTAAAEENGAHILVEDLVSVNNATMDAFLRASEAVLKGMASLNEEVISFADKRLRASFDTGQSLVKCSNIAEAMELQSDYAREATEDYLEEATKILNLSAEVTKIGRAHV